MKYWNGYQYVEHEPPTSEERVAMLEAELDEISSPRTYTQEEVPVSVEIVDISGEDIIFPEVSDDRPE